MLIGKVNQTQPNVVQSPYLALNPFPDSLRLPDSALVVLRREPLTFWCVDTRFGVPGRRP